MMSSSSLTPSAGHLIILGGGSAAFSAALTAEERGWRVSLVNAGLRIGGTCVNVGCVPSKTLLRAAEALHRARGTPFAGLEVSGSLKDFGALMRQKTELVDALQRAKYLDVIAGKERIQTYEAWGKLLGPRKVEIRSEAGETQVLEGDRVLIATGAKTFVPEVPGLADFHYLDHQSAFELERLPSSLIVIGGRYIALELAQLFQRLGTQVQVLQRSSHILPTETETLTEALRGYLEAEGMEITTSARLLSVEASGEGVRVQAEVAGEAQSFEAERLLLATGRRPNGHGLGLEALGVEVADDGRVVVDAKCQAAVPGIYAAGDVIGPPSFVYTAAYEGGLAARNAIDGAGETRDYLGMPWVVFTDPQVAGIGLDLPQARAQGLEAEVSHLPLSQVPRCLAARDTRGFLELIRDPRTDLLLGARVLAPEGSEILMEVSLAIRHKIPVKELAKTLHPYLTLSEAVKLAAISFGRDVSTLSCCAS